LFNNCFRAALPALLAAATVCGETDNQERIKMRTVVTVVATALLVVTTLFGMPSCAQSQVIVIIGNGSAQPYYPPPPYQYPTPYPNPQVVYGAGYYYPGYLASQYGYNYSYYNGYHGGGFYRPYGYGW
jgi:hypothetical protein